MKISGNTKIASIVHANPLALEAIISISKSFEKLRNPYLYRLMAKRASILMASKIAGCSLIDFEEKLRPLGFELEIENSSTEVSPHIINKDFPNSPALKIISLDVRPLLENGIDPLQEILAKINVLTNDQILELTNTFLPIPLISLLEKKGFVYQIVTQEENLVIVRFHRNNTNLSIIQEQLDYDSGDWDEVYAAFENSFSNIDVRQMKMPQPMITILEALDFLNPGKALYVKHHKVPLFLLPELAERNIEYRIRRINDTEVHLILFHKK